MERDIAPEIGAEAAAEMADVFCRAEMGEKHQCERLATLGLL